MLLVCSIICSRVIIEQRLLALYSGYGSYNEQRVLTAIQDNSRSIRNKAIDLITLVGSDEDEKLRRLALSPLIAQTKSKLGWNQARLNRLHTYSQNSSILVAAAAQFVFPPDKINAEDY